MAGPEDGSSPPAGGRVGRYRWGVCALLLAATVINYVDRQMIGVLKPTLQHEFAWSEETYGDIIIVFQATYALGYVGFGRLIDRVGARAGYAVAMVVWTIAHMAHAGVRTAGGFMLARAALGAGESGGFPAALRTVADWFPRRERALAAGILNAGANLGAVATPLLVSALTLSLGWRATFLVTGLLGVAWLPLWWRFAGRPEDHLAKTGAGVSLRGVAPRGVSVTELAHIRSDAQTGAPAGDDGLAWPALLRRRETWAYGLGRFLIDPVWWLLLFWLPDFLARRYGLGLADFGPPLAAIYLLSDLGSVGGGWLSSRLLRQGWGLNRARKATLLLCVLATLPLGLAPHAGGLWLAVAVLGLAAAGHQGFSVTLYTLPSDLFPAPAVGSVVGFGGAIGALGGMLMARYAAWVLDATGGYGPIFAVAGGAYAAAFVAVHLLTPSYAPVRPAPT